MADGTTITFKAWFVVKDDGTIQMIDSGEAAMNWCDGDEAWFGPYHITIPTPKRIFDHLSERSQAIAGTVKDG